ncbi:MAG: bifunctional diaminohydroxyphosphoribosylaminopyrimidine deaminase/5-amino-6-(5-phosphoribosylamino)uracil reductase RibD [Bacteroidota bacterium]
MQEERRFMQRCLQLASLGSGKVAPNPMVGSVVVVDGRIVGEGFHQEFGGPHAEVMAIRDALKHVSEDQLRNATLYVNLEPCSHHGKTPPCTELLIARGIPRVVVGTLDPFQEAAGRGLRQLHAAGIKTDHGMLEAECLELNRRFFIFHQQRRPYILLKFAQSADGFMAPVPGPGSPKWISGPISRKLVHKWRTEEQGIMVGANTARIDNPQLTARLWPGRQPVRIVIDRKGTLPSSLYLFDRSVPTIVFSGKPGKEAHNLEFAYLDEKKSLIDQLLHELHARSIQSVMVEGGRFLLDQFIERGTWDEARIFTAPIHLKEGIKSPGVGGKLIAEHPVGEDRLSIFMNS